MKIELTTHAIEWFEKEVGVSKGSGVRFMGKVYGKTEVHEGFSVGMNICQPEDILTKTVINGVTYFIEKNDDWFFSGYNLKVDYDKKSDEPIYTFIEQLV
ncbi:HesB/YadR/YfhF family protein [Carnobacterium sp. TMP28]|uniref:HesB/YadR/YfhF family protein n=1 Tax=Carnobacterium sp. TMP28 TaxID=3397060 RepID=UPI0039DFC6E8